MSLFSATIRSARHHARAEIAMKTRDAIMSPSLLPLGTGEVSVGRTETDAEGRTESTGDLGGIQGIMGDDSGY